MPTTRFCWIIDGQNIHLEFERGGAAAVEKEHLQQGLRALLCSSDLGPDDNILLLVCESKGRTHTHPSQEVSTSVEKCDAAMELLMPALAKSTFCGQIWFCFDNLSRESAMLMAKAVAQNEHLRGFSGGHTIAGGARGPYYPGTEALMRQAVIVRPTPLAKWCGKPLPADVLDARKAVQMLLVLRSAQMVPRLGSAWKKMPLELTRMLRAYFY